MSALHLSFCSFVPVDRSQSTHQARRPAILTSFLSSSLQQTTSMVVKYPLDAIGTHFFNIESQTPLPKYPFHHSILARIISKPFYEASLNPSIPILFSIIYYILAHYANIVMNPKDRTKGQSIGSKLLRFLIIFHNALLCFYSFLTFSLMTPIVLDLFWQGYRSAGHSGIQLALCSIPTNNSLLGRWTYLFYLSKYYEVIGESRRGIEY